MWEEKIYIYDTSRVHNNFLHLPKIVNGWTTYTGQILAKLGVKFFFGGKNKYCGFCLLENQRSYANP